MKEREEEGEEKEETFCAATGRAQGTESIVWETGIFRPTRAKENASL